MLYFSFSRCLDNNYLFPSNAERFLSDTERFLSDAERFPSGRERFPSDALEKGGNMPCILNATNEIAVAAFLEDKIGFPAMSAVIEKTMERVSFLASPGLEDYVQTDAAARAIAGEQLLRTGKSNNYAGVRAATTQTSERQLHRRKNRYELRVDACGIFIKKQFA